MDADSTKTRMWFEAQSKSVIYLRPVLGGGHGYNVKVQTDRPIGRDYQRDVYCADVLIAAERVQWLMTELVPGDWSPIPVAMAREKKAGE